MKEFEEQTEARSNRGKMTLRDYYESLPSSEHPKTDFVNEVVRRTGVSSATVRNWIFYGMRPLKKEHVKVLSDVTGIPQDALWGA